MGKSSRVLQGKWFFRIDYLKNKTSIFIISFYDGVDLLQEVTNLYAGSRLGETYSHGKYFSVPQLKARAQIIRSVADILRTVTMPNKYDVSFQSDKTVDEWRASLEDFMAAVIDFLAWEDEAHAIRQLDQELREGSTREMAQPLLQYVRVLKSLPHVVAMRLLKSDIHEQLGIISQVKEWAAE